jgi:hypothetical protein
LTPSTPTPPPTPPTPTPRTPAPTIPLTPDLRAAYEDLYDKYETAIENTRDPGVSEALQASQLDVEDILTKDDLYQFEADTALYAALLQQITTTNTNLATLKTQIEALTSHVSTFGDILAAITKVLTLVPTL